MPREAVWPKPVTRKCERRSVDPRTLGPRNSPIMQEIFEDPISSAASTPDLRFADVLPEWRPENSMMLTKLQTPLTHALRTGQIYQRGANFGSPSSLDT